MDTPHPQHPYVFSILTLFPEVVRQGLDFSLLQKAQKKTLVRVDCIQLRDFATDVHASVDDTVYGGGAGMLLKVDVMHRAWVFAATQMLSALGSGQCQNAVQNAAQNLAPVETLKEHQDLRREFLAQGLKTVLLSPQGKLFSQSVAQTTVHKTRGVLFVCGHYEGVDERFIDLCVDEEWSLGDYVLSGGEYAALVMVDVLSRFIPGVVKTADSVEKDSLSDGLLKYPQYTKPQTFLEQGVPEVLRSGHHKRIEAWREDQRHERTKRKRPDLWQKWSAIEGSETHE